MTADVGVAAVVDFVDALADVADSADLVAAVVADYSADDFADDFADHVDCLQPVYHEAKTELTKRCCCSCGLRVTRQ